MRMGSRDATRGPINKQWHVVSSLILPSSPPIDNVPLALTTSMPTTTRSKSTKKSSKQPIAVGKPHKRTLSNPTDSGKKQKKAKVHNNEDGEDDETRTTLTRV